MDCSVCILNVRRQFDLPVPDGFFWRTFQNPAIRSALMKLPLSWSPRAKKPHLRVPDRNQDRGEQTAQQDPSPAASLMWDRLLWASSWRRMESQKPWELLSACQVTFTSMYFTKAWELRFTAPLWGRKLLPPLEKWGVRMSLISRSLLCAYGLLTPPSFLQALSSLDNSQSQTDFTPLSCLSELYRLAQTVQICCPVVRSPYLEQSTRETKLSCKAQI